ncbi:hypothetical protein [Acidithiobacillus sp.]|uniref:hypothetical protein n=1 Tax=Acidithiobacillus sp. TaxID=1872118 RepID=UPI003D05D6F1
MFIVDIPYQHTPPAAPEVRHVAPAPQLVHAITPPAGPATLLAIRYTGPAGTFFARIAQAMGYRYIPSAHPAVVQGSIVTVQGTQNAVHALQQAAAQLPQAWAEKMDEATHTLRIETDPTAHWAPPAGYKEWTK